MRSLPFLAAGWLLALAVLLCAGDAGAYCREVTAGPPSNYDPGALGCFGTSPDGGAETVLTSADGGLLTGPDGRLVTTDVATDAGVTLFPLFWRNQCVSYSFQRKGSKHISASDTARIAAEAFAAWSNAPCAGGPPMIVADPYPVVDCDDPRSQGHNNIIIFRDDAWPYDDGSNAIGYTTLTVGRKTGEVFGADIEINSFGFTIAADVPASGGASGGDGGASGDGGLVLDLGSILTHEAGHFLGLAHSADTNAVMYAHYHPGATSLTPDDVAGICSIYHADGTRETGNGPVAAAGCMPAPPLGFLTSCGTLDSGIAGAGVVGSGGADPNEGNSDAGVPCPDPPSCAMGRPRGAGTTGLAACGFVALSALARSARRASRKALASVMGVLPVALLAAGVMHARDARASVSATVLFDQLLEESSAVAEVMPTEQRSLWEGDRIVTYTHVRVDRLIVGQLTGDVWVRTLGGEVGDLAQIVEGQATFALEHPSLVFLRVHVDPITRKPTDSFVVVERGQGQFPVVSVAGKAPRLALAPDLGLLLARPAETDCARGLPRERDSRSARDVLDGRPLEEAAREIAAAWRQRRPDAAQTPRRVITCR